MQGISLSVPLVVGAGMKIGYDLLLYAAFRKARPPEMSAGPGFEREAGRRSAGTR